MVRLFIATLAMLLTWLPAAGFAEEVSKEQIKGLDEQVQEIKTDALGIAAELNRLEEKLLYPSNTQVSLFVSLAPGSKFRLDTVEIQIDGQPVTRYLYALKELEALQAGGVQRIYTGNIKKGDHTLQVNVSGKSAVGGELRQSARYKLTKDVAPKLVGITLSASGVANPNISFKDW